MSQTVRFRPLKTYRKAALGAFLAAAVIGLLVARAWAGPGHPAMMLLLAIGSASIVAIAVPYGLDLRNPCFRTRDEIEQLLALPVLATCPPRGDR